MDKERDVVQLLEEQPTVEPVGVMTVLRSIGERMQERYPAASVRITGPETVSVAGTAELPGALEELVTNALEHNDSDSPTVEVNVHVDAGTATVEIADDGPGIPEMEAVTVTGETEETPLYHGRGLGLWFVHLVVRRCGGHVEFEDADADGSTVTVVLDTA
jgi:signal transduction histidine kinase